MYICHYAKLKNACPSVNHGEQRLGHQHSRTWWRVQVWI